MFPNDTNGRFVSSPLDRLAVADTPSNRFSRSWRTTRRLKIFIVTILLATLSFTLLTSDLYSYTSLNSPLSFQEPIPQSPPTVTATVTSPTPTVTKTVTVYKESHSQPSLEPVVFALLAWSESSGAEATLLIKSILMYITGPVELHIICDPSARKLIEDAVNLVTAPTYNVKIRFYLPEWHQMAQRVDREGTLFTEHAAGLPGLMKLFLHEIVPVDKAIYVDTDAIFISDPRHLWNVFTTLKPETAIVMSSHGDSGTKKWFNADRICSCVMLLDFAKLRKMRLMNSSVYQIDKSSPSPASPAAFRAKFGLPNPEDGRYHGIHLGDQGYWWAIVDYFKDLYEPLSFDYEVSSCLYDMYETRLGDPETDEPSEMARQGHVVNTAQQGKLIRPKLLHFNCLHGTDKWWEWEGWEEPENRLNRNWGSAMRYHAGFKWIWLNRGPFGTADATPRIDVDVAQTIFSDEAYARQHGIAL